MRNKNKWVREYEVTFRLFAGDLVTETVAAFGEDEAIDVAVSRHGADLGLVAGEIVVRQI